MLLCDWQRICFKVSFDQVTVTRGLRCKRHVKAASWQITQNAFEPADVIERCGFGHILWDQSNFWTTVANAHQNTLIIKILDVSSRFVFKDLYFCFQHFVAGPGRGTAFTGVMWLSHFLLKREKKTISENLSIPLTGAGALTSICAFHLIRLQKPAVYSAAVTKKRWEAEPASKGAYLPKKIIGNSNFNEKANSCELTLQTCESRKWSELWRTANLNSWFRLDLLSSCGRV